MGCHFACQDCKEPGEDKCLECDETNDHRILVNGRCACKEGYFDSNEQIHKCVNCKSVLNGCDNCFYNTSYQSSDVNSVEYGCLTCDSSLYRDGLNCVSFVTCNSNQNKFLISENNTCATCTLS